MTILNPNHLFEQAEQLLRLSPFGPPRQTELRRAISNAYYGVLHATLAAAADQFVGVTKRSTPRYALVYRSVDHRVLRDLCQDATKPKMPTRYARYAPGGFDIAIRMFAAAVLELLERRHAADYDPLVRLRTTDAIAALNAARTALARFRGASEGGKEAFLAFLLFPPR